MDKIKILIIDDEPAFTEMVKLNLEATGRFYVKCENDAQRAILTIFDYMPDLILLDVIMPWVEGPDIACKLRESHLLKDIPVIFLTATVTHDEVVSQNGKIGGHEFLSKPTTIDELIGCINRNIKPL